VAGFLLYTVTSYNLELGMTSLPLVLDGEPIGIILRAGQRCCPSQDLAYCWFSDERAKINA